MKTKINSYFLSFGLVDKNLGVVCTQALSEEAALCKVSQAGLNPGGEAAIWQVDDEEAEALGLDRLISPAEMRQQHGYKSRKEHTKEEAAGFLRSATIACQACNETKRN